MPDAGLSQLAEQVATTAATNAINHPDSITWPGAFLGVGIAAAAAWVVTVFIKKVL